MQKKLIALAVASALTVPALALADTGNVTIYGNANVSYDFVDSGTGTNVPAAVGGTAVSGVRSQRVSSNVSAIGLKGSEDLGGGLTAVWQVEQGVDIGGASGATNGFGTQNTFVGLSSGSIGTFVLGRHDTPYKIATRGLDQFGNGIADNRSLMGQSSSSIAFRDTGTAFDGRQGSVIAYISPAMAGLTVAVGHVNLNQTLGVSQSLATDPKMSAWSLAGLYGNGPFFASLAYEAHDLGNFLTVAGNKEKAWKLGLGYTQDLFNVGLAYEKTSDDLGAVCGTAVGMGNPELAPFAAAINSTAGSDCAGHSAWYLGGKYNISASDAVKLSYSRAGNLARLAAMGLNASANQWAVGYDHAMSKRTTVYALYTRLNNNADAKYGLSGNASAADGVGAFGGNPAGNTVAGYGADPSAVSIGLKHSF